MGIFVGEVTDLHVDRRLRSDQRDVGAVGEQRRRRLVAAIRGRKRRFDADLVEVALRDRDIGWSVQDRTHHLVVSNLRVRLALRERAERRGDGERAESGKPGLQGTAAIEHVGSHCVRERGGVRIPSGAQRVSTDFRQKATELDQGCPQPRDLLARQNVVQSPERSNAAAAR